MAVRRLADAHLQPKEFAFTAENLAWAKKAIARYPDGRQASAVIPLLWKAQEDLEGGARYLQEFDIKLIDTVCVWGKRI